ncbi:retrotransposable element Tf2 [Tanacetum coccineum]
MCRVFLKMYDCERPKECTQWLALAEYWYNTNFHTFINTTPFEVVYCQTPLIHLPYLVGESMVDSVDKSLLLREQVIDMLKFHLKRAQDKMKNQADKHRTDRSYEVGDWVYLKLQPYRKVRQNPYHKLSAKYYGPFLVCAKVGQVAYKLHLPSDSLIHPVFHVSQLEKCRGPVLERGILPQVKKDGLLYVQPMAILDKKLGKWQS